MDKVDESIKIKDVMRNGDKYAVFYEEEYQYYYRGYHEDNYNPRDYTEDDWEKIFANCW